VTVEDVEVVIEEQRGLVVDWIGSCRSSAEDRKPQIVDCLTERPFTFSLWAVLSFNVNIDTKSLRAGVLLWCNSIGVDSHATSFRA
jgi:hypothetical protein